MSPCAVEARMCTMNCIFMTIWSPPQPKPSLPPQPPPTPPPPPKRCNVKCSDITDKEKAYLGPIVGSDRLNNYCSIPCSRIPPDWEKYGSGCLSYCPVEEELCIEKCKHMTIWSPSQPKPSHPPPPPQEQCRIKCDDYGQLNLPKRK